MTVHDKIRNWLRIGVGHFNGTGPQDIWSVAHKASSIDCTMSEFIQVVNAYGYKLEPLGAKWIIALPPGP